MSPSPFPLRLAATVCALVAGAASATTLQELPKGARAGDCFSRTTAPSTWRTERVPVAQPPRVSWREVPPVFKTVTKQVLVSPGRVDHQVIPAVMGTRIKWIAHPGADRIVEVAPVYRWVERRVMVAPEHLEWRRGAAAEGFGEGAVYGAQTRVQPTGEVMCRVLVPARYAIHRVRVLAAPGRTCVVKGPSTRERIVEHFVVAPQRTVDHPVAPVYRTVSERVLVTPGRREKVVTPQPPRAVEKPVQVTQAHTEWTRIVCAIPRAAPVRVVRRAPQAAYGVHLQPGDAGYGQAPVFAPAPKAYAPDYPRPRPAPLQGAPAPPSYRAPRPGDGYGGAAY